jgi:fatty acid synthase subunit beta
MASLFSGPPANRPLVLHSKAARVHVLVPASPLSAWVASEVLAQEFHDADIGADDEVAVVDEDDEAPATPSAEPQIKLLARFLSFAADKVAASTSGSDELAQVLLAAYNRFNELFLGSLNVHSLVQSFDPEPRAEILTAYFKAFAVARKALGDKEVQVAHTSAVLDAAKTGETELYGLFGGQGVNEVSTGLVPPQE